MKLTIPELSLIVLIGPSGAGKSTFCRKHFKPTEVLSSDFCRGLVSDDENDQTATKPAFEVLHYIASKRLERGLLTVIDATNVQPEARKPLVELARKYNCLPVAIVFNLPEDVCQDHNKQRPDRDFGQHVIKQHIQQMRRSLKWLPKEGFRHVFEFRSETDIDGVEIEKQPLWNNLKHEHGPFDIIGDVHGCFDELYTLLGKLGYVIEQDSSNQDQYGYKVSHPEGRKAVFLGDLVDRGPNITGVLRLVMSAVKSGCALCVPGNHDIKLVRKLGGKDVQITHGLKETLIQLEKEPEGFAQAARKFLDDLVSHYVLDDGKLVVAHAGMKEAYQGRGSKTVREFALFGETTGETDEFGLPVRYDWSSDYRGRAMVVYGHTPVAEAEWVNNTINIDTGCVFGGKLTAFRYPEKTLVDVPAAYIYYEPSKPFLTEEDKAPALETRAADDILDIDDVCGKRIISTRFDRNITIREENAIAALEVMSRYAVDPHWLIYLPPTMSPSETSKEEGYLEYPAEAFAYFRNRGIPTVVCEEKHMGSRAVVVVCKDEDAAMKRFGIRSGDLGICYTRTGRHFFDDKNMEVEFIDRIRTALTKSGFWEKFNTDWVCLDCELMPWSAKAQALIKGQYAPVGVAGRHALEQAVRMLESASSRPVNAFKVSDSTSAQGMDIHMYAEIYKERLGLLEQYTDAYRRYCWAVNSLNDIKLAPFHILATEGAVHTDKDHLWHMSHISEICAAEPQLLLATRYKTINVTDPESVEEGIRWWGTLTASGGEGMVVKPMDFTVKNQLEIVQPAVKCRGREYLRIIYGPEYTVPENLERLRKRSLGKKRSLAIREFALGVESLERFVRKEPLYRVHECVFGVLALESEPVDPRL